MDVLLAQVCKIFPLYRLTPLHRTICGLQQEPLIKDDSDELQETKNNILIVRALSSALNLLGAHKAVAVMVLGLKSIDEVIQGIDSLLGDIEQNSNNQPYPVNELARKVKIPNGEQGSFRVQDELMPDILLDRNQNTIQLNPFFRNRQIWMT